LIEKVSLLRECSDGKESTASHEENDAVSTVSNGLMIFEEDPSQDSLGSSWRSSLVCDSSISFADSLSLHDEDDEIMMPIQRIGDSSPKLPERRPELKVKRTGSTNLPYGNDSLSPKKGERSESSLSLSDLMVKPSRPLAVPSRSRGQSSMSPSDSFTKTPMRDLNNPWRSRRGKSRKSPSDASPKTPMRDLNHPRKSVQGQSKLQDAATPFQTKVTLTNLMARGLMKPVLPSYVVPCNDAPFAPARKSPSIAKIDRWSASPSPMLRRSQSIRAPSNAALKTRPRRSFSNYQEDSSASDLSMSDLSSCSSDSSFMLENIKYVADRDKQPTLLERPSSTREDSAPSVPARPTWSPQLIKSKFLASGSGRVKHMTPFSSSSRSKMFIHEARLLQVIPNLSTSAPLAASLDGSELLGIDCGGQPQSPEPDFFAFMKKGDSLTL
jgi:hypothetical protein